MAAHLEPGAVVVDFTRLWAALGGHELGPDAGDPLVPLVSALHAVAVSMAVERGYDGFVTTASRAQVDGLEARTGQKAVVLDPGEDVVRTRLADPVTGELSPECADAIGRWF